jgi:hypothetical protein
VLFHELSSSSSHVFNVRPIGFQSKVPKMLPFVRSSCRRFVKRPAGISSEECEQHPKGTPSANSQLKSP